MADAITDPTLASIAQKYKALAPHMGNAAIVDSAGKPGAGNRHLEFYPPYDSENPRPGKITFELFDKMNPKQREEAVAADALHHLGGYQDAEQKKPVDPAWLKMKNELISSRTPAQIAVDNNAFAEDHDPGDTQDKWFQRNRGDAYIRAGMFPEQNPDWQRPKGDPEGWTPEQTAMFDKMHSYLRNGATEPPPFEPKGSLADVLSDRKAKTNIVRADMLDSLAAALGARR